MHEFYNKLILKDEEYKYWMFPQIPNYKKQNSAYILADGINDNIVVNECTTTRQIRQGKYKRLIEISTAPYMEEIRFNSSSKEASLTFKIYVKAVIQVKDPIVFYNNRNLDVTSYFTNMFSLDVRKITRKYSILDYDGMDETLTEKLSSFNNIDVSTGFEYRISAVDAEPGDEAIEYVDKKDKQSLTAELKNQAKGLAGDIASDYKVAMQTQVIEGKISEEEAIIRIYKFNQSTFEDRLKQIIESRDNSLITDVDASNMMKKMLPSDEPSKIIDTNQNDSENDGDYNDSVLDGLYDEE